MANHLLASPDFGKGALELMGPIGEKGLFRDAGELGHGLNRGSPSG